MSALKDTGKKNQVCVLVSGGVESAVLVNNAASRYDAVDRLNDQVFRELLTYMMQDPKSITRAVDLILISRNIERIADHATNISEDVIFIVEGKNIKHHITE